MTWMAINGDQMKVPATQGVRYFDFYHGEELKPDVRDAGHWLIRFPIEAKGYGAVLATNGELSVQLKAVLARMKPLTSTPLASFSHESKILPVQIVPIKPTEPATSAPDDMVKIPPADFDFEVAGIENRRLERPGRGCAVLGGRILPGGFTRIPCTSIPSISTSTQSRMSSSRDSWTPRTTIRKTI